MLSEEQRRKAREHYLQAVAKTAEQDKARMMQAERVERAKAELAEVRAAKEAEEAKKKAERAELDKIYWASKYSAEDFDTLTARHRQDIIESALPVSRICPVCEQHWPKPGQWVWRGLKEPICRKCHCESKASV